MASIVARRHPKYEDYVPRWEFWLKSYLGGEDYITKSNLFQYFKEGDDEFEARLLRAYRENHSRWCIDLINAYLFQQVISRKTSNATLQMFFNNMDGDNNNIDKKMRIFSQYASALGRIYLVVDKLAVPKEEATGTAADNLKAMPYVYKVHPQDMLDLAFDDYGDIKWALIKETTRDDDDPFAEVNSTNGVLIQFRLWLPGSWMLFSEAGNKIDEGVTGIDVVPIVILDNEEHDSQYVGQSLIADIAPLDRAIFNNWSRLDTIVNDQTFSQLVFPIQGLPAGVYEDDNLRDKFLVMATSRILLYNGEGSSAPAFIAPDAAQAQFILTMIGQQTKQLYAMMGLQGESGTEVNNQSGVSKSYDFQKLNKVLASKSKNLEQAEKAIIEIFNKWQGNLGIEAEIEYPSEFDVASLMDEVLLANQLALLNISKRFMSEIEKNIVMKALPKATEKVIKEIFTDIDDQALADEEAAKEARFAFDEQPVNKLAVNGNVKADTDNPSS